MNATAVAAAVVAVLAGVAAGTAAGNGTEGHAGNPSLAAPPGWRLGWPVSPVSWAAPAERPGGR